MLNGVALSVAAFLALGLVAQLVRGAVPGDDPLKERLHFQYAVIGLGMAVVAAGGVYMLDVADTPTSYSTANRVLGALMLLIGLGGAGACLAALLQRRRRQRG